MSKAAKTPKKEVSPENYDTYIAILSLLARNGEGIWGEVLYKLILSDREIGQMTVWTQDGLFLRLNINFSWFDGLSFDGQTYALKHIGLHFAMGHYSTYGQYLAKTYSDDIYTLATDMVVSQALGDTDPPDKEQLGIVARPEMFGLEPKQSAEYYCRKLSEQKGDSTEKFQNNINNNNPKIQSQQQGQGQGQDQGQGRGQGQGQSQGQGQAQGQGQGQAQGQGQGQSQGQGQAQGQGQGQAQGQGQGQGQNQQQLNQSILDDINQSMADIGPAIDKTYLPDATALDNIDSAVKYVSSRVESHMKSQGTAPGGFEEFVKWITAESPVDVRTVLRCFLGKIKSNRRQRTRVRLSRRLPGIHAGRINETAVCFAFAIDTSGSMGNDELSSANAFLKASWEEGAKIFLIQCDTDVYDESIMEYDGKTPVETFYGRGGTDFRPAFDALYNLEERPDGFIFYTDGYGTAPEDEPECPVVWLISKRGFADEKSMRDYLGIPWGLFLKYEEPEKDVYE